MTQEIELRNTGITFAHFDEDSATFTSISENNSVMYKLEVRGSNADSTKPARIRFNGVEIVGTGYENGLNFKVLTPTGQLHEEKVFYGRGAVLAMRDYLSLLKGDYIIAMATHGELFADPISDVVFSKMGSVSFPNHILLQQMPRVSYAAIYSTKMGKIVCEGMQATNGEGQNSSIQIEKVYDTIDDLAITGTPQRFLDYPVEYVSEDAEHFELIQWPHDETSAPLEDFNIKAGDKLSISFELFRDSAAAAANVTARFYHNYFTDGQYKTGVRYNASKKDQWEKFEAVYTVPEGVDSVVTGCIRYPTNSNEGIVKIRNILITPISGVVKTTGPTSFGVNGVRTTHIQDNGDFTNPVMSLLKLPRDNKHITSNNFKEFDVD
ncbi:hypothetical protein AAHF58_000199 [Escherichia coli]